MFITFISYFPYLSFRLHLLKVLCEILVDLIQVNLDSSKKQKKNTAQIIRLHIWTYLWLQTRVTFASRQSTPDDLNITSSLTRMPSDSDMASILSDEALSSPPSHKSGSSKSNWSIERILSASLSTAEREAVLQVDAASKLEDLELFARLNSLHSLHFTSKNNRNQATAVNLTL